MRRSRQRPPDDRFAGTHFSDLFLEWFKGFGKRKRATQDATQLSNEILNYRHELFPIRSVPIPSHPGYVTHKRDYFTVQFANGKVNKNLTEFFSEEDDYKTTTSFGGAHDMGSFFEMVFDGLLVNGMDTHAVEWEEVKINKRKYILPISFNWLNPVTVHLNKYDEEHFLVQKFHPISRLVASYYDYQNHSFSKDESLIFNHPTVHLSPVAVSLKYLKKLTQGMDFGLLQGQANIEPTNHSLELEKTRYMTANKPWRKQNMTRVKVRRIFNQPIGGYGISVTTYYEVFAYIEYKKHLNIMREYVVAQFNEQIMTRIQEKNGYKNPLVITYQGFITNEEIDAAYSKYKQGEMTVDELVAAIKDKY